MNIREEFQRCRKAERISITDLSKETGISRNTITAFERGNTQIGLENLEILLKAIGYEIKLNKIQKWEMNF